MSPSLQFMHSLVAEAPVLDYVLELLDRACAGVGEDTKCRRGSLKENKRLPRAVQQSTFTQTVNLKRNLSTYANIRHIRVIPSYIGAVSRLNCLGSMGLPIM